MYDTIYEIASLFRPVTFNLAAINNILTLCHLQEMSRKRRSGFDDSDEDRRKEAEEQSLITLVGPPVTGSSRSPVDRQQ